MEMVLDLDGDRPRDDEIMAQHYAIRAEEAGKISFLGNKEPLSTLAAEYELGNSIFKTKIEKLGEIYGAIRRTRGDGNCFFRAFMFSYLENLLETKNNLEAARVKDSVEKCKQTLLDLGHAEFTFEDFLASFTEQLDAVQDVTLSVDKLVDNCRDQAISDSVVMFFRFITSGEIRKRADFFEPFIFGTSGMAVQQFCRTSVEPMGEESDHVHITALSDALGVPIRIVYLDSSVGDGGKTVEVNFHDFIPSELSQEKVKPPVMLLYRPGHYDILYEK
ncbi:hypothetical protein GOP47_0007488 [Adiantum capillus-veneris]|uniref:Ubiquitin thioesterase n=1 Tax=Adiantum capillus-veneris TaxID=13818 RepID=A0A9D4ZJC5_ADICA|nr:hypothetical protein GOP47_0007488 [Adiantum capillus-veneris]